MKYFKRILYFLYYLKNLNKPLFKKFVNDTKKSKDIGVLTQYYLIFVNSIQYNISILEFYQFGFLTKSHAEKLKWMGTGSMYELQLKDNPPKEREILDDKRIFYKKFKKYIVTEDYTYDELVKDSSILNQLLSENKKLVLKEASGKCGVGVQIILTEDFNKQGLLKYMKENKFDLIETFIVQHPKLQELSPSAVNTIRIFTRIDQNEKYKILGCRLRISINSPVDNMAAGNLAAEIDEKTGVVLGDGVYSDITKQPEKIHPITGIKIQGFQIPFWNEILELVKEAHFSQPQNKSIGWDVVVTEKGPGLIEGNHDWCKLVWQLPVNKGLKHLLVEDV